MDDHQYDVFELLSEGPQWRSSVVGRDKALARLNELSLRTTNEIRLIDSQTGEIVAAANKSRHA
jgi:hypothetical protein